MFLKITLGDGDILGQPYWEILSPYVGESSTLNTGVCPRVVRGSSLWQILEPHPQRKYYLSRKACLGILRRARKRGKELPATLKLALEMQSGLRMIDLVILAQMGLNGGRLPSRVAFYCDEFGTMPAFDVEALFSAGRSRGITLVPIIQSLAQLEKNYGREGAEILTDNCQDTIFGGFAPNSQTAEVLSRNLGSRTVLSGSVTQGKDSNSQSLQMMERPLMTPDELKSMPKGSFIVAKTGVHPMKVKLRLFLDWGIRFGMPYEVPEKAQRFVAYADKQELEESIIRRHYGTIVMDSEQPQGGGTSAGGMAQGIQAAPDSRKTVFRP